ncbi:NAD-binding phosphogluconate dehydrogenase-like protein [Mycena kentingensis (nom. inval.)]|nr:NAD-binding phosphogluconate dehydrogenase-like protein [Mycena kentingensis (nom. inval.)]
MAPVLAVIAPGAMGAGLSARLSSFGSGPILTNLDGRSAGTLQRAEAANMQHASYTEIVQQATYILSVVPPGEAFSIAETIIDAYKRTDGKRDLVFVDCNAINVESAKRMAALFEGTGITFLDASVVGLPPTDSFNPAIYVSAHPRDLAALDAFAAVSAAFGLNIVPLKGDGAGIGDASAVKMSHSIVVKGLLGLLSTSILAANASSASTAEGLLHALHHTQPNLVTFTTTLLPQMLPKAYRFVAEMDEAAAFLEGDGARTFEGISGTFARIARAHAESPQGPEIEALLKFAESATQSPH